MKKTFAIIIALISILSCVVWNSACKDDIIPENILNEELQVISMFMDHGTYRDGTYTFTKYNNTGNCSFLYSFSYSPTYNLFSCSLLSTTKSSPNLYDYGSVTFSWGNIDSAVFYGYHELENISIIEFSFSDIKLNSNVSLNNDYSYRITKNTFKNLTKKEDIDDYASTIFESMDIAIGYAQTVLYSYTSNITLK
ncbi:MAG: hypothetical protein IKL77_02460 [Clostridia bacterium]|nr:hypothetical protein [Clostridia bacterium]